MKYSVPKEIPIAFHNPSNCDYHFVIKYEAGEFEKLLIYLGKNTEKYITLTVTIEIFFYLVHELRKMEKKLQKIFPSDYNLLIAQGL